MNRRNVLTLAGLAGGATLSAVYAERVSAADPPAPPHLHHHAAQKPDAVPFAGQTEPFQVRMPVPPVLRPVMSAAGVDVYDLSVQAAKVEILPGVSTEALTFGGSFVGPTIRAKTGRRVVVRQTNKLAEATNVHLHGGHVPPGSDGHPMDVIEPGRSRLYDYPNQQRGATLWYHDHSHHTEAEHVYRGLHGFYLVEDPAEQDLKLPSGDFDVPILLRDALFDAAGALVFNPVDPLNRPTLLANGKPQPYFPVSARKYRFRLLNGSTHRVYRLSLQGATLVQIASDGGLLPQSLPVTELTLSPAERADVVIDFSGLRRGQQVLLTDPAGAIVRFDVTGAPASADDSRLPARLRALPASGTVSVQREVKLAFRPEDTTFTLNGQTFDPARVDMRIKENATEIWKITNTDTGYGGIEHNFHLHLVQFRVLDRDGVPPAPNEAGLKDTVRIPPGTSVRVQATFAGYRGRYLYHCHMLEHSQLGMMAQFEVVA